MLFHFNGICFERLSLSSQETLSISMTTQYWKGNTVKPAHLFIVMSLDKQRGQSFYFGQSNFVQCLFLFPCIYINREFRLNSFVLNKTHILVSQSNAPESLCCNKCISGRDPLTSPSLCDFLLHCFCILLHPLLIVLEVHEFSLACKMPILQGLGYRKGQGRWRWFKFSTTC